MERGNTMEPYKNDPQQQYWHKPEETWQQPNALVPQQPNAKRYSPGYAPVPTPHYRPAVGPQPNLLVFGILSLALAFAVSVAGIVLGTIGRSKGNDYLARGGMLTGASRTGYSLSLAGLIVGILMTCVSVVLFIIALTTDFGEYFRLFRILAHYLD